jgi:magnesium-dependent phosphatase-1
MKHEMNSSIVISLVVFDGDDTLWSGLDGGYISGTSYPDVDRDDFNFRRLKPLLIQRDDGQRFRLYPEVPKVLPELVQRGVLVSLASYNHTKPLLRTLEAFGISGYFQHPAVEWNGRKDKMLRNILRSFTQDGFLVSPETTLFIDDDYRGLYRGQMASIGVHFLQKGVDIQDLGELLSHPRFHLVAAQKSLI